MGLVVLDFRFNGFDLLPDLVGWGVVLIGLLDLVRRSAWFVVAAGRSCDRRPAGAPPAGR